MACNELGAAGRAYQHRARPAVHLHLQNGCPGIKPRDDPLSALLVHLDRLLFLLPEEPVPLSGKPAGPVAGAHFQHSFAGLYAVHHDADGMRHPDRLQHQSEPRDRRQQGLYRRVDRHAERAAAYFPAPERSWKRYAAIREL